MTGSQISLDYEGWTPPPAQAPTAAGWLVELRFGARDGRPVGAEVADRVAAPGLPLWFAEVHGNGGSVPTAGLLAFAGRAAPRGLR